MDYCLFCFLFCHTKCTRRSLLDQKCLPNWPWKVGSAYYYLLVRNLCVSLFWLLCTCYMANTNVFEQARLSHAFSTKMPGQYRTSFLYQGIRLKTSLWLALNARRTPSLQQPVVSTLGDSLLRIMAIWRHSLQCIWIVKIGAVNIAPLLITDTRSTRSPGQGSSVSKKSGKWWLRRTISFNNPGKRLLFCWLWIPIKLGHQSEKSRRTLLVITK